MADHLWKIMHFRPLTTHALVLSAIHANKTTAIVNIQ
jgi:hypothetical protein